MRTINLTFLDRDVRTFEDEFGRWFTHRLDVAAIERLRRDPTDATVVTLLNSNRNGSVVHVATDASDACTGVTAWRGLIATSDLYYAVLGDGSLVMSDHVRNVVAHVPVQNRSPDEATIVEHYLCLWIHDRGVFSGGVSRLAGADRFEYDPSTGAVSLSIFDRYDKVGDPAALTDLPERVEAEIQASVDSYMDDDDLIVTFSGGVDSTLVASFFPESSPLVTMTIDSPEFDTETEYAYKAAELLGRDINELKLSEADYVDYMEHGADITASPPKHYVSPTLTQLHSRPETTLVYGFAADSIFGSDRGLRRISGMFANGAGLAALKAGGTLPGQPGYRARQLHSYASKYAKPTDDPRGAAGSLLTFGDTTMVDEIAGTDAVNEVLNGHLQAVADRVAFEMPEEKRFWRHMEMGMWRNTMSDNATGKRLGGLPAGKTGVIPYSESNVVDALLAAPAQQRYIKGLAGKWVLKDILARRVPGYPINQRKNATGLPFERYVTDGPLTNIWDNYTVPDFFDASRRDDILATPSAMTWKALSHAVWSDRIGSNTTLTPHPAFIEVSMPASTARE